MTSRLLRETLRWTTANVLLASIVLVYVTLLHVNPTTAALTLLLYVLMIAAWWGMRFAVVASVAAALCFNFFFLPPVGQFVIASTQNWVAFFAFLVTALIGSNLSNRIRSEAQAADRQRRELELLYDFGQRLLSTESTADLVKEIPQNIVAAFQTLGAALYLSNGDRFYVSDPQQVHIAIDRMRDAVYSSNTFNVISPRSAMLPLSVGVRPVGSVLVEGHLPSQETLEAMSSLIAISIESATAVEKLARADAAHESERLRSALLDSVTHDLRTPLTSIKASVSSLLTQGALSDAQRTELLTVIDEESDRLNVLIGQATEMARLDAHQVVLEPAAYTIQHCVDRAIVECGSMLTGRKVEVRLAETLPRVWVDLELIVKVLWHLLENAAKYSPVEEAIVISGVREGAELAVSVADHGAGIEALEQEMIFDKFYRGQSQRYTIHGTGMGLAISKAIMEAHGGSIHVTSQPGHGSVFTICLPIAL